MGAGDVLRELLIKLGITGGQESKATVDSVTESVERLTATDSASTSATEASTTAKQGQVEAARAVTKALTEQGAVAAEVAAQEQLAAKLAGDAEVRQIERLNEVQIAQAAAAEAVGAMAAAAVAGGAKYEAAIAAAAAATARLEIAIAAVKSLGGPVSEKDVAQLALFDGAVQASTRSLEKHASGSKIAGAEAAIMRDNVGSAARAVATMGGSAATAALGIGVAVVALDLVPTVLEKIDSKSKAWAASLVDLVSGLHEEDVATRKASESQEAYETRIQKILDLKVKYNIANIALAAGLIVEADDLTVLAGEWEGLHAAQTGAFEPYPEFVKALKEMGVTFTETHHRMTNEAQLFGEAYSTVIKRDGIAAANAWLESNKAVLDKIVSYYERAGQTVPAELAKMAAAIQLYTAAEKEAAEKKDLRQKLQDEENAATFLVAKVQELAKAWGSEKAAVTELAPVMDTVLASLLKMHGATVAEEAGRQAAIKSLKDLLGQYGLVPSALEKVMASTDKINEKHKEHELRLAELNREYALHVKTVTDAADKSAAAVAREADAVRTSMTAQIKELQKEHAEGLIENAEYFEKLNLLVSVQNLAANAAATERARLSQKERDDLDKLAEKHRETAGKIEESVKRGTDAHAAAAGDIQHSSEQIVLGLDAIAKAAIATFGDVVSGSSSTALSPGET